MTVSGPAPTLTRDLARRPFEIAAVRICSDHHPVSRQEVLDLPQAVLTVFTRREPVRRQVLLVAPMSGGFAVLLRDLVLEMLRHVDRVAITDWRDERYVAAGTAAFGFDDNVLHVRRMMEALGPDLHVVAVCQGSVPTLAASALIAADGGAEPLSIALLGAPLDPAVNPTRTARLAAARPLDWFATEMVRPVSDGFTGAGRPVYPRAIQAAMFWSYVARHVLTSGEVAWKIWADDGEDPARFPFIRLASSLMDIPGPFFLENIDRMYHRRLLASDALRVVERPVEFAAISRSHLLTIEGGRDDIAAPGQSRIAHGLCSGLDSARHARVEIDGAGHFSLFHGRVLRERVGPVLAASFATARAA